MGSDNVTQASLSLNTMTHALKAALEVVAEELLVLSANSVVAAQPIMAAKI